MQSTKAVLRCVDGSTGHTLFNLLYYEPPVAPVCTVIRGKEMDVLPLQIKKDVLTGLLDAVTEEMIIHHLQA